MNFRLFHHIERGLQRPLLSIYSGKNAKIVRIT